MKQIILEQLRLYKSEIRRNVTQIKKKKSKMCMTTLIFTE